MRLIFLFLLLNSLCYAQSNFQVYLKVVPGQEFNLVNDSLFPTDVSLDVFADLKLQDSSAYSVTISLINNTDSLIYSSEFFMNSNEPDPVSGHISFPLGQYLGLNQFSAIAVLRNRAGASIQTLNYSSFQ